MLGLRKSCQISSPTRSVSLLKYVGVGPNQPFPPTSHRMIRALFRELELRPADGGIFPKLLLLELSIS